MVHRRQEVPVVLGCSSESGGLFSEGGTSLRGRIPDHSRCLRLESERPDVINKYGPANAAI